MDYYHQTGSDGYSQAERDEAHFDGLARREQREIREGICTTCHQPKPAGEQGNGQVQCQGCRDTYLRGQIAIYQRYYGDFVLTGDLEADVAALHDRWRADHPLFTDPATEARPESPESPYRAFYDALILQKAAREAAREARVALIQARAALRQRETELRAEVEMVEEMRAVLGLSYCIRCRKYHRYTMPGQTAVPINTVYCTDAGNTLLPDYPEGL